MELSTRKYHKPNHCFRFLAQKCIASTRQQNGRCLGGNCRLMVLLAFWNRCSIQYHQLQPSSSSTESSWMSSGIPPDERRGNLCEGIPCLKKGHDNGDVSNKHIKPLLTYHNICKSNSNASLLYLVDEGCLSSVLAATCHCWNS